MIGKFLDEQENKPTEDDEIAIFEAVEKNPSAPFVLPDSQTDVLSIPVKTEGDITEQTGQIPVFRQSEELTEVVPLAENQTNYTVAPTDALASVTAENQVKVENYHETPEENLRKTGLAWSAATVLGGSVVFMLILGWFFDLVFGSKPWGIVGGIVLGAIIGFIQFFRITSQIFKKDDNNSLGI